MSLNKKGKGKAVPLQAWSGPEDSRKLRFRDFMITAQDGGKVDHTKYQRDALNIIYSSNILLYMFRATSAHLQEEQLYVGSIWYRHSL